MKIAFFDSKILDYSPATPGSRPLGGSQSGLCYLSRNMARAGHKVALVNNISQPGNYSGVECPRIEDGSKSEYLDAQGNSMIVPFRYWYTVIAHVLGRDRLS